MSEILVVDDEQSVRDGMSALLSSAGATVMCADGIEPALAISEKHRPDIALVDFRLRDNRSGLELVSTLRDLYPAMPAIIVTGDTDPQRLREADRAGIPLLHKPVAADELLATVIDKFSVVNA